MAYDKFRDECAVAGIFGYSREAAKMLYLMLHAMQHRGPASTGITARDDDGTYRLYKELGLVSDVFTPNIINGLPGSIAIGHNRYKTAGDLSRENAQPFKGYRYLFSSF